MTLILHIETAVETASVCLAKDGVLLQQETNNRQRDHAAWIHEAIGAIIKQSGYTLQDLSAIAVSAGPGSYTGLRVGMATAKGLAYALHIPLININTLQVMAQAAFEQLSSEPLPASALFVPMIDARRAEVFMGIFNQDLTTVVDPHAKVLDAEALVPWQDDHLMIIFGNGSLKCKDLVNCKNLRYIDLVFSAKDMIKLSHARYHSLEFDDLAYAEPHYTKAFYSPEKKS